MKRLILLRHTETRPSKTDLDPSLSFWGRMHAKAIAQDFPIRPQAIFTTETRRAKETGQYLATRFRTASLHKASLSAIDDPKVITMLREMFEKPDDATGDQIDYFEQMVRRLLSTVNQVFRHPGQTGVVITHNSALQVLEFLIQDPNLTPPALLAKISNRRQKGQPIPHGQGLELRRDGNRIKIAANDQPYFNPLELAA